MKGNCIDKFINHRYSKRIIELLRLRSKIRKRIEERDNAIDYFNTSCYENDFSDIIEIRNKAKELVDNCNEFLERISEQYSKFN